MLRAAGWCAAMTVCIAGAARAQQQEGPNLVGRAAQVYRQLSSLRADFDQVIDDQMLGLLESSGELVQAGTSKLSMRFTDPKDDAIVADGKYIWIYTPSTTPGQVVRMPLPTGTLSGVNVMSWLLDRPAERYRARYLRSDQVGGRAVDVVELVPIVPDLPFKKAVVWLDKESALPRRLEIEERPDVTRTLTLSRIRTNQPVATGTFEFAVPSGVRIVSQP